MFVTFGICNSKKKNVVHEFLEFSAWHIKDVFAKVDHNLLNWHVLKHNKILPTVPLIALPYPSKYDEKGDMSFG